MFYYNIRGMIVVGINHLVRHSPNFSHFKKKIIDLRFIYFYFYFSICCNDITRNYATIRDNLIPNERIICSFATFHYFTHKTALCSIIPLQYQFHEVYSSIRKRKGVYISIFSIIRNISAITKKSNISPKSITEKIKDKKV